MGTMRDSDALHKARRLSLVSYWLYRNPRGLSAAELARLCGVCKRTSQRDLHDLQAIDIPIWDDGASPPRYGIVQGYYLPPVHLTLDDALALYLAARLLAHYADAYDPHIAQALAKLAAILPESIARHIHATIRTLATRAEDRRFVEVLGVLAVSWASGRKARIWHQAAGSVNTHEYLFSPYFIEPSAAGAATYAIGHSSYFEALHTFKVERIQRAELTSAPYEIPTDFDGPALLAGAWGIWFGGDSEEVVLRFCAAATRRVKETRWHPSQSLEDLPDGGCLLRLRVAEPLEMVHWVRGWGPQVEVLEPPEMRAQLAAEAAQTLALYGGESK